MLTPIPPSGAVRHAHHRRAGRAHLGLAVQSINGLHNWTADTRGEPHADAALA
jgi:hypothetical protein